MTPRALLLLVLLSLGLFCCNGLPQSSDAVSAFFMGAAVALISNFAVVWATPRAWNDSLVWPAPQVEVYDQMPEDNDSGVPVLRTFYASDWKWECLVSPSDRNEFANQTDWMEIVNASQKRMQFFLDQGVPNGINPNDMSKYYPVNPSNAELVPLTGIRLHIRNTSDTHLSFGMDESYEIRISDPRMENSSSWIEISSTNVYGAMYGLESFKQLLQFGWLQQSEGVGTASLGPVYILRNNTVQLFIYDAPVYSYRGIMIDTSRHYLPLDEIMVQLQIMSSNKLNVLHWHLTDSQSFPYASERFPELAIQGAYCYPECVYNASQIQLVIHEASLLGIRVIVEIDLPGHSQAIGESHPEFLSLCYDNERSEPLDVTNSELYNFVHALYAEVSHVFSDPWIHLGGDEVSLDCWKNSSAIQKWMVLHNVTHELDLLQLFELDLLDQVIHKYRKRPIVWQDLFDSGVQGISKYTILDIWKDWIMEGSLYNATNATYDVVFSACWYLDHLSLDWWSFYTCNPRNFANLSASQQSHVLGGHSSMWGESVDVTNFFERVWPRSSATAEVLWSGSPKNISMDISYSHVQRRLAQFRCYMVQQFRISVSPIAPGHCQSHGPIEDVSLTNDGYTADT